MAAAYAGNSKMESSYSGGTMELAKLKNHTVDARRDTLDFRDQMFIGVGALKN